MFAAAVVVTATANFTVGASETTAGAPSSGVDMAAHAAAAAATASMRRAACVILAVAVPVSGSASAALLPQSLV